MKYAEMIRDKLRAEIQTLKSKEECSKFSLTFDEWTSKKNKRFMNINLHFQNEHRNLGLIRINASASAENLVRLIIEKLNEFNLNMNDDIISVTTDGPNVMKKVGRIIPCLQQFCYAHGLQLAVIDVLYKQREENEELEVGGDGGAMDTIENEETVESDSNSEELDDEDEDDENDGLIFEEIRERADIRVDFKDIIEKVRKTVKIFKSSPTKNDTILQKYILQEEGERLELVLDCKTRWNSLVDMLTRFYRVQNCISKSLIDLKSNIRFTEEDWECIAMLQRCLQPVKLGVEVLSRRDATLLTAETTLKFIIKKLAEDGSSFSKDLVNSLCKRIKQRRTIQSAMLLYLHNPSQYEKDINKIPGPEKDTFKLEKKAILRAEMKRFLERFVKEEESPSSSSSDSPRADAELESRASLTLQEELEKQLSSNLLSVKMKPERLEKKKIDSELKREMITFEAKGSRGRYLNLVYKYLLTIPPTSVEAERAFSAAGLICSQLRTRLTDESLSSICFLRGYFQSQRKMCN